MSTAHKSLLDLAARDPPQTAPSSSDDPLWRCERTGIWVVESYRLVNEALSQHSQFSSKVPLAALDKEFPAAEVEAIYRGGGFLPARTLQTNDPPAHRAFRSLVERVFTPSKVEAAVPGIKAACSALLLDWASGSRVDAISRFAVPLPLRVIAQQLGVPDQDLPALKRWSDAAIRTIGLGASREEHLLAARCGVEFQQYFAPLLAEPARQVAGSLVERVALAGAQSDPPVTLPEQLSLLHTLMIAGHETTTSTLGSLLLMLAERGDLAARLRGDERLQRRLIEEALRLHSPVQGLFRITMAALVLGGVTLPARTLVCLRLGAANRDMTRFAYADEPVLAGPVAAHLSFGAGIHHCIGAPLARRELAIALQALLARFAHFELAADARPLRYSASVMTRALISLPMIGTA